MGLCYDRCQSPRLQASTADAAGLTATVIPADIDSEIVEYPGFTVSFNKSTHIPNYVAWQLTREHTDGPISRKGFDFAEDPAVPGSATPADYRRSGYDRGHMAPAGDMKWSADAMRACFYMTNMCPQDDALNRGSWATVESNCRNWAVRDSLLVIVCGPVLTDRLTRTIGQSGVVVPQRFFKVVLAPYANPPRAIGFVMNNGVVEGGAQRSATTVDEVERITGYDFFSALPDEIENQVEQQCNYPQWQRL